MKLAPEQEKARDAILAWADGSEQAFVLGGYAGTGKTTMLREIFRALGSDRVSCHTPTGKAAAVLTEKLGSDLGGGEVGTIHSLLYTPDPPNPQRVRDLQKALEVTEDPRMAAEIQAAIDAEQKRIDQNDIRWIEKGEERDIVIVDEASMVSPRMEADLRQCASRILFVGDPFQLPPVDPMAERRGEVLDFFERNRPDAVLTEIHRQAGESAVLAMATAIRNDEPFNGWNDTDCRYMEGCTAEELAAADAIITGKNATRRMINRAVRRENGYDGSLPGKGERLICLRNDKVRGFVNGVPGVTTSDAKVHPDAKEHVFKVDMIYDGRKVVKDVKIDTYAFELYADARARKNVEIRAVPRNEFDFGYAMTVHKSQGSEWDHVLVYDDAMQAHQKLYRRRWAYTAATRAAKRLTWVKEF